MNPAAKWEYMKAIDPRYHSAKKKDKKGILDEFCKTYKCHRKHAIRLLNSWKPASKRPPRRVEPRRYGGHRFRTVLEAVWEASGHLWSRRLKAAMPVWMPSIRKRFKISPLDERLLLLVSPAQIENKDYKKRYRVALPLKNRDGRIFCLAFMVIEYDSR